MARIAVAQLHDGDTIEQAFVISGKQIATTANSKLYIKADCSDATGQIPLVSSTASGIDPSVTQVLPVAHLYAGGGIVRDSDPASELAETEVKLQVMLPLLAG